MDSVRPRSSLPAATAAWRLATEPAPADWLPILQRLGFPATAAVTRLAATRRAVVVRIRAGNQRCVVKVSQHRSDIEREAFLAKTVVPRLPVRTPRVVADGVILPWAYVAYADDALVPIGRNQVRLRQGLAMVAALHRTHLEVLGPAGNACTSHTPAMVQVMEDLQRTDWAKVADVLAAARTPRAAARRLKTAYQIAPLWEPRWTRDEPAVCHGDLHLGNFMWSLRDRRVYLIDWEYLHPDSPYFDLFQLLDATSPTTPLVRPMSHRAALAWYLRQRPEAARGRPGRWLAGYRRYAITHLLWILTRIADDWHKARFPAAAMVRQTHETVHGLFAHLRELPHPDRAMARGFASVP
ncbi:hypothetical protein GCM10010885_23340 [Alicyclobacillus cellulosilyticus]|uniref:Aminoglycoside phosphotransferase domain-containing protein n=1 Tax=Alicyclobacillus cellulosilyticus TaxID=1003997 RepID=A0A917KGX1_9BACL|nr:aminoglycoside phosphotransferase family protein [Alicyclobacillus cellulosilyticus]GGJ13390.1 hypothetical protein GCM10010885_23340 [Alicyclobacillus cellulosilyticus]